MKINIFIETNNKLYGRTIQRLGIIQSRRKKLKSEYRYINPKGYENSKLKQGNFRKCLKKLNKKERNKIVIC